MVNPTTVPVTHPTALLRHLPAAAEWRLVYATASIPIHIWAVLMFFFSLPAYLMRMSIWNMLNILAYVLSLALIESLIVTVTLAFIALILPKRLFKQYFVPQGVLLVILLTLWMIPVHLAAPNPGQLWLGISVDMLWPAAWVVSLVGAGIVFSFLLRRHPWFARLLTGIAERFTLLAAVYFILDIACLVVVIIRLLL